MSLLSVHLDCDRWGRPRHPLTIITKGRRKNEFTEFGIEVHFVDTKSQIGQVLYRGTGVSPVNDWAHSLYPDSTLQM